MEITVKPGKYVIAVSGGVDSMVLLNMLSKIDNVALIVAHFDHGIRENSDLDRKFVEVEALKYQLPFIYSREELGPNASENTARLRRYKSLEKVKLKHGADAIITAHHKDDVIETAILNVVRGTGRHGLTSLKSGEIIRPLLDYTKAQILDYAQNNGLVWRDDPSNTDLKYARNKIRRFLSQLDTIYIKQLESIINDNRLRNEKMDSLCEEIFSYGYHKLHNAFSRHFFISLPYAVAKELTTYWLRKYAVEFDKSTIERLVVGLKVAKPGAKLDIDKRFIFALTDKQISIESR